MFSGVQKFEPQLRADRKWTDFATLLTTDSQWFYIETRKNVLNYQTRKDPSFTNILSDKAALNRIPVPGRNISKILLKNLVWEEWGGGKKHNNVLFSRHCPLYIGLTMVGPLRLTQI